MLGYQRLSPGTMVRIGIDIYEKFDNYALYHSRGDYKYDVYGMGFLFVLIPFPIKLS
jgi:hypothetical protein